MSKRKPQLQLRERDISRNGLVPWFPLRLRLHQSFHGHRLRNAHERAKRLYQLEKKLLAQLQEVEARSMKELDWMTSKLKSKDLEQSI